jgi:hypothetical protein
MVLKNLPNNKWAKCTYSKLTKVAMPQYLTSHNRLTFQKWNNKAFITKETLSWTCKDMET